MVSFAQLWEIVEKEKSRQSPLMDSGEESQIINVVRTGKDLHKEEQTPFWDEFITLCSDSSGLSSLLGVSQEKILSWPSRIKEALDKLEKHTAESPNQKQNKEILPTGDNGAFTTNQDPQFGDLQ